MKNKIGVVFYWVAVVVMLPVYLGDMTKHYLTKANQILKE